MSIDPKAWLTNTVRNRLDEKTEQWLRENDPLYYNWRDREKEQYPYLTKRQMEEVSKKEIPVDALKFRLLG